MYLLITTQSGFEKQAKMEAEKALQALEAQAVVKYTYFKGLLLSEVNGQLNEILEKLRMIDTRYINRILPLQAECKSLSEALSFFENVNVDGKRFAVRCNRRGAHDFSGRDVEIEIGAKLKKSGGTVDLEAPELLALVEVLQEKFYVGMADPADVIQKRPAIVRKWAKGERPVSRAELKMGEVMRRYPEIFHHSYVALDIGAAPGGWSRAMAGKVRKVFAVDPAELNQGVAALKNVVHIKVRAEALALDEKVDIVANDANVLPMESARISMEVTENYLRKGGYLVHTVKLGLEPGTGRRVAKSLNHAALEVIREFKDKSFEILYTSRLKYNTRNEKTIIARYLGNEE